MRLDTFPVQRKEMARPPHVIEPLTLQISPSCFMPLVHKLGERNLRLFSTKKINGGDRGLGRSEHTRRLGATGVQQLALDRFALRSIRTASECSTPSYRPRIPPQHQVDSTLLHSLYFLSHLFAEFEGRLATPSISPEHLNRGHITRFPSLRLPIPVLVRY